MCRQTSRHTLLGFTLLLAGITVAAYLLEPSIRIEEEYRRDRLLHDGVSSVALWKSSERVLVLEFATTSRNSSSGKLLSRLTVPSLLGTQIKQINCCSFSSFWGEAWHICSVIRRIVVTKFQVSSRTYG